MPLWVDKAVLGRIVAYLEALSREYDRAVSWGLWEA